MAEGDEEDAKELDFEGMMEAFEKQREERRNQVTYDEVETIRSAGELSRETEDVDRVSEELDLSKETTEEALTVYRLVFEDPPGIGANAVETGHAFFSPEKSVDDAVDEENLDEPVEDLLREYVGKIYLEFDVNEEPVGDPIDDVSPPLRDKHAELAETVADSIPTESLLAVSRLAGVQDSIRQSQAQKIASIVQPMVERQERLAASMMAPIVARQQRMVASALQPLVSQQTRMAASALSPVVAIVQDQQEMMDSALAGVASSIVQDIQFPEPVLADLASFQPAVSAAAAASSHPSPSPSQSVVDEASKTEVEFEPLEASATTVPETNPVDATVDATLPDADTFSTELVFEIPAMIVESMLNTGQARVWFTSLPEDYQLGVVNLLLAAVVVSITRNPYYAPIAVLPARIVRQAILIEGDLEE